MAECLAECMTRLMWALWVCWPACKVTVSLPSTRVQLAIELSDGASWAPHLGRMGREGAGAPLFKWRQT